MKTRGVKEYIGLVLKGIGMGAADVVPGVSGGTIAFIVGIYEELINSIKSINITNLKLLFTLKFKEFFTAINAPFLIAVMVGIGVSVVSLARVITYMLEYHPIIVWSLFFGLIISSVHSISREVKSWGWSTLLSFAVGTSLAAYITLATPANTPDSLPFIFLCGSVAICAMILPGISGSFILLLMGKYHFIMEAIKGFDLGVIAVFGAGAAIGIVLFSNILSYLFSKFHDITIALLAGFMLGSLGKVWPWKEIVIEDGIEISRNISPNDMIVPALIMMIIGGGIVLLIEKVSANKDE
ncbi:MAG: DUF368 domain-containing protein [Rikenellaceae bacterium]